MECISLLYSSHLFVHIKKLHSFLLNFILQISVRIVSISLSAFCSSVLEPSKTILLFMIFLLVRLLILLHVI